MPDTLVVGEVVPRWDLDIGDYIHAAAWCPDGTMIAIGALSGEALSVAASDGSIVDHLAEHPFGVLSLGWSPSGDRLATGGHDGLLRLYDRSDGDHHTVELPTWVGTLAWSPDGSRLAAGAGRTLAALDRDGAFLACWSDLPSTITSLAWADNSKRIGAGCYGGPHWYDTTGPNAPPRVFDWKGSILTLAVAPNGKWLASGNQDNSVHVWRLWSADDMQMSGYPAKVEALAWDHTSRFLAVANVGDVTIWDFAGKGPRGSSPKVLDGFSRRVTQVAYEHRGSRLAGGSADGLVAIWEPTRSSRALEVIDLDDEVSVLAWSPDDTCLLFGTATGRVGVVDVAG